MPVHKGTRPLVTERLRLRRCTPDDAEAAFRNWTGDPRVPRFLSWEPHASPDETRTLLTVWSAAYDDPRTYHWFLEYEGEPIGSINAHDVDDRLSRCRLGYSLGPRYWNRGLMTEAVRAVLAYLFGECGFHRVEAFHDVDNPGSGRVMRKAGLRYEGCMRGQTPRKDGGFGDLAVFGLLYEDWAVNTFRSAAALYDLDQRDVATDDLPFYLSYGKEAARGVLALGCGTGRAALPLVEAGCEVTGLDLSEQMLSILRRKAAALPPPARERLTVVQGDMAYFAFDRLFGLILAPFRAFQALTDDRDVHSALDCVRRHLRPDGLLILNVFRPHDDIGPDWVYDERVQWERMTGDGRRVVKKHGGDRIDTGRQILYPHFSYEVTEPDGTTYTLRENLALKYYFYDQLKALLLAHGFVLRAEYGWYDKSEIQAGRELIFVCGKGGRV